MATLTKGKTFVNGELVTPANLHQMVDAATVANIVNADISAAAAIADTKLAQITTAGKVANSATTATNASTPNAIVARDGSGNFSAGTITANLTGNVTGNAGTATILQTARTINGVSFNGSANIIVTAAPDAHSHDDRYYTETEMNTLLAGKQAAGSYAPATGIAQSAVTNLTTDLAGKAAISHTHDDRYYTETEVTALLADKQKINGKISSGLNWNTNQGILFNIPENVQRLCLVVEEWSHADAGQGIVLVGTTTNGILDAQGPIISYPYMNNVNNVESFQGFSITGRANTTAQHAGVFDFFIGKTPAFSDGTNRLVCRSSLQQYTSAGTFVSTLLNGAGYVDYFGVLNQILLRPLYGSTNPWSNSTATLYFYY
jgi:hypothetical protein